MLLVLPDFAIHEFCRCMSHQNVSTYLAGMEPFFTNDAIVLGILMVVLGGIFVTVSSRHPFWQKFYRYVPALVLCYFIPALLNWPLNLISGDHTQLYFVASRYLLPACLILLCLSIDFKGIIRLGPKALIMFFTGTVGVVIGGPIALLLTSWLLPGVIGTTPGELWRGLSTVAGSWIGGGANQTAMKEIFEVNDNLFGTMIVVDVVVANIWMAFLLYGANISDRLDRMLKADNSAIHRLTQSVIEYRTKIERMPTTTTTFVLLAVAFGGTALSHWGSDILTPFMTGYKESLEAMGLHSLMSDFFWLIVIATTIGLTLSFTKARALEGVGASRWGTIFIYVLVATIGMKMNLGEVFKHLGLFAIGGIWMLVHVTLLLGVAKLIKAPFFFVAVGSQANIGGAASAPVVASAFNPALAPVGVLLAVLGYAMGTYGALLCAYLMQLAS